jgi:hypothetical protein
MDSVAVDMYAFYQTNATNGAAASCPAGGVTFAPFTFAAVAPQAELDYPPTVGATIASTTGFNVFVHYLNMGSTVAHGTASLTMQVAKTGVVTNRAGALFLNQATMTVSPLCTTASGGCPSTSTYTLPQTVNVLQSESVTSGTTHLFALTGDGGVPLFQTTQWLHPTPEVFAPALSLPAGTVVKWTCTDTNDTGATMTFGEHAMTNLMCASISFIYPISDYTSPVIGSQF